MMTDIARQEPLSDLLYDHAAQLDLDSDYWFRLRGHSINPMIDAVTPLLGMVLRVRQLSSHEQVSDLYQRVVTEIQAIEQELAAHGYENGVLLSFRYILCTFIDEAVMGREWGSQSEWSEHSLLARFHNETWGGEKVFVLLSRLQEEPQRYRDILEFIYLCLCLGFEGRYRVMSNGREEFERLVHQLHRTLYPQAERAPLAFHLDLGRQAARYRLSKQISLRTLCLLAGVTLAVIFGLYHHQLDNQTQDVLRQLGELLK
ncbi:type IVB secretion system protein IcmH/DotU [Aeromonas simiae]|uniref:type IVB secretion system protein IcmH/DotU n=1 Tax=Aeromonas simiae TaxID=218936 RepID=UPI00266C599E|nr:type IVB secretion system protein IcmH/DotU [Aeromonas simiae]MDO2948050.1 type IVB secretion system protein IcmH/DotU [Aeromonas simiae]MDO2953118.1 type IVB secretion system protein IcmH/DotU [Aeromonas simiae]MDO2955531.1 type IVB secretion system protein IcmH/DotU [Aeromonas simiae]